MEIATRPCSQWGTTKFEQVVGAAFWQVDLGEELVHLSEQGRLSNFASLLAEGYTFVQASGNKSDDQIKSFYDRWYDEHFTLGDKYHVGQKTTADKPLHVQTGFGVNEDIEVCLSLGQGANKINVFNHTMQYQSDVFFPGFLGSGDHTVVDGDGHPVSPTDRDWNANFHALVSRSDSCGQCCLATEKDKKGKQWKTMDARLEEDFEHDCADLPRRDGVMIMSLWGNVDIALRCLCFYARASIPSNLSTQWGCR